MGYGLGVASYGFRVIRIEPKNLSDTKIMA